MFAILASIITCSVSLAEEKLNLTKNFYINLLPKVKLIHGKGPSIYYGEKLKQLKFDWKGLPPTMVIVSHNNVDVMITSKDSKVIRYNFNRMIGLWTPMRETWVVNYNFSNSKFKQIHLGNRQLSAKEYKIVSKKQRLYEEFLQSKP